MANYSFTISSHDVTSTTQPTFDGSGRQIYSVSSANLDAIISALEGQVIGFSANANEVNQKLKDACKELIDAISPPTSVTQFFIYPSKANPNGPGWIPSSPGDPRVLHPSQNGSNVCVSVTGTGGTTYWRQVDFDATGGVV